MLIDTKLVLVLSQKVEQLPERELVLKILFVKICSMLIAVIAIGFNSR